MRSARNERHEWGLLALLLLLGLGLMLGAAQFALQMPRNWQANRTNMNSNLNPNEVYRMVRGDGSLRLAPIRMDVPVLQAPAQTRPRQTGGGLPPASVDFKTPAPASAPATQAPEATAAVPTTTSATQAAATSTSFVPVVPPAAATGLKLPTAIKTTAAQPVVSAATATVTGTPTVTRTSTPTLTVTGTSTPTLTATPTLVIQTATQTATGTATVTWTPVVQTATQTATGTATVTWTPVVQTATQTATATGAAPPTETGTPTATAIAGPPVCDIRASGTYSIPAGGCWVIDRSTSNPGWIYSFSNVGSSLGILWDGLGENETTGDCQHQNVHLPPGGSLVNIAVALDKPTGVSALKINNSSLVPVSVDVILLPWTSGGCQ
jgi:hypothetical protein